MNYFELQKELLKRDYISEMEEKNFNNGILFKQNPIADLILSNEKSKIEQKIITDCYKGLNDDFKKYKEKVMKKASD